MVSLAAFYFICFTLYFVGIYKTNHPKTNCDVYEGWILMIGVAAAALAQTLALTHV